MTTVLVNDFSNGMVGDERSTSTNVFSVIKHCDPVSRGHRLTPYNNTATGNSSASTHKISDFIYYTGSGAIGTGLYGLGYDGTNVQLYSKDTQLSATSTTWSTFANSVGSASGQGIPGVFVQYKGSAYGSHSDGTVWKCQLNGGGFSNNDLGMTNAASANGLVHSVDDCLYMPSKNLIYRKLNTTTWDSGVVLTLPSNFVISCLSEFNNYLAIAGTTIDGKATVYLWDRQKIVADQAIDWGFGSLKTIQQVEEYLVGVSIVGASAVLGGIYPKMQFRSYISGAGSQVFNEIFASSPTGLQVEQNSMRLANRMYFAGGITIDGVLNNGIFAIQRPTGSTRFSVWIDKLPNNDTATVFTTPGFIYVSDLVYVAYFDSTWALNMTDNQTATRYNSTATAETTINPNMKLEDRSKMKELKQVSLTNVPITSDGGQVVLQYKVDGSAWATVITQTTVGAMNANQTPNTQSSINTEGREFKFRINIGGVPSVGLVEPIELKYSYENKVEPI